MTSVLREELISTIDALLEKYSNNTPLLQRLKHQVTTILPHTLEEYSKDHVKRENRKKELTVQSEKCISGFIIKENIYYAPNNELFLKYDGTHFKPYSEDNIQHDILTQVTAQHELRPWKQRIKNNVITRIKRRSPLAIIPESNTIQYVMSQLYPAVFPTRNRAKYFLTVVGDIILSKNTELVYIANPCLKQLIVDIAQQAYLYFGITGGLQQIKYKFYDHSFKNTRLLCKISATNDIKIAFQEMNLFKHMIDVLCVSVHYSNRYKSSDDFLKKHQHSESTLYKHARFLANHTVDDIVQEFIKKYIKILPDGNGKIASNDMIFIWRKYILSLGIPNVIFYGSLHAILRAKLTYDSVADTYCGITSIFLPQISNFSRFWENTIKEADDSEIELDEIPGLFAYWNRQNKNPIDNAFSSPEIFLDLIRHFYPSIEIEDDKYIGISCSLWDKTTEVKQALELFKISQSQDIERSVNGAYLFYATSEERERVVSKRFFERLAVEVLDNYIDDESCLIDSKWFGAIP